MSDKQYYGTADMLQANLDAETARAEAAETTLTDAIGAPGAGGINIFSGTGAATQFNIPHGLGATPSRYTAIPASAAAVGFYATANATNIVITFASAPANAANNVSVAWTAHP
jgi:hypothetical protein